MAGVFDLELHDAPDSEFLSDDEANEADTTVINVTEIEVLNREWIYLFVVIYYYYHHIIVCIIVVVIIILLK